LLFGKRREKPDGNPRGVSMAAIIDLLQQAIAVVLVLLFLCWDANIKSLRKRRADDSDIDR